MGERAEGLVAYTILLMIALAGMMHAQWWAICAGSCMLILISLVRRQLAGNRFAAFERGVSDPVLILSSVINGSAAAGTAFAFGHFTGWVWGL